MGPISKYVNLQELKLSRNKLSTLQGLGNLKRVVYIDASENELTELLDMSPPLSNVREANFANNAIRQISSKLENFQCLKVLSLDGNSLDTLDGIEALRRLEVLSAAGNSLTSCSGLSQLQCLRELDLSGNNISSIDGVGELGNLEVLKLSDNAVESLERMKSLTSLRKLDIQGNDLAILEEFCSLSQLGNLKELNIAGNPCCLAMWSRLYVIHLLPQLGMLDDSQVSAEEKIKALNMQGADIQSLEAIRTKYFPEGELDDGGNAIPPLSAQLKAYEGILDARQYFGSFDDKCKSMVIEGPVSFEDFCDTFMNLTGDPMELCRALYLWVNDVVNFPAGKYGSMSTTVPLFKDAALDALGPFEGTWAERVSQLFVKLCKGCELVAEIVNGFGRSPNSTVVAMKVPNHCWAAICIDDKWCLVDCVWQSFCVPPFAFFMQHFPLQRRWQLQASPNELTAFWEMPRYSADFALLGLEIEGSCQSNVAMNFGCKPYCFTLAVPEGLLVRTSLCDNEGKEVFWTSGASSSFHNVVGMADGLYKVKIYISPPKAGDFLLLVYAFPKSVGLGKDPLPAMSVKVSCLDVEKDEESIKYPLPCASERFSSGVCSLVAPLEEPMLAYAETDLKTRIPGAVRAWVTRGADASTSQGAIQQELIFSAEDGTFSGTFTPEDKENVYLSAAFDIDADAKPEHLLSFYPLNLSAVVVTERDAVLHSPLPDTEEAQRLARTFEMIDRDADGRINKADVLLAIRKHPEDVGRLFGFKSKVRQGPEMVAFETKFATLDVNQLGFLTLSDCATLLQKHEEEKEGEKEEEAAAEAAPASEEE